LIAAAAAAVILVVNRNGAEQDTAVEDEKKVITSFYPMYVAAQNITDGIDSVSLESLSEPKTGCLHDYQLTPEDMRLLSKADIFIVNGGGIENFLTEVAKQYPDLEVIEACEDLNLSHNAHAWMSLDSYKVQIKTIESRLRTLDEDHAKEYERNAEAYIAQIDELAEKAETIKDLAAGVKVGVLHEAFEFLAQDYDMDLVFTLDLHEEEHSSAGEMKEMIEKIKENDIEIVFADEDHGKSAAEMIERETNCKVYFLDPLVTGEDARDGYLTAMEQNIDILAEIFTE